MNFFDWNPEVVELEYKGPAPKILQLTDPHIFEQESGCLLGLNTRNSLQAVLDDVKASHLDADLILATGDISQDHSCASYRYFANEVEKLGIPTAWIPGNHDTNDQMATCLIGDLILTNKRLKLGQWEIILLDSSVPHAVFGKLGPDQLNFLRQAITGSDSRYLMPVLHHHPIDIGCDWMAPIGLHDADELFTELEGSDKVKALLWGHVHQEYDAMREQIRMLATPSTSVQFKPGSKDFAAGEESPGYRTLTLADDGTVDTRVFRIEHIEFTVDYTVKGY